MRAKSLAILLAERPSGQGKEHLFTHGVLQQQAALFIIPDFCLIFRNCVLSRLIVDASGTKNEVEVAGKGLLDGFDAPGAEELEAAIEVSAEADVVDKILWPAVFDDEDGLAFELERPYLVDVRGVVDRAGGEGFVQWEGFVDELCGRDEHVFKGRTMWRARQ